MKITDFNCKVFNCYEKCIESVETTEIDFISCKFCTLLKL